MSSGGQDLSKNLLVQIFLGVVFAFGSGWGACIAVKAISGNVEITKNEYEKLLKSQDDIGSLRDQYELLKESNEAATDKSKRIVIRSAQYGKKDLSVVCDAYAGVQKLCSGLDHCLITPNNGMCGDPAANIVKYLHLNYSCGERPMSVQIKEAVQGSIQC